MRVRALSYKKKDLQIKQTWASNMGHFLAVWSWANHSPSLCFSFNPLKIIMITFGPFNLLSSFIVEIKQDNTDKGLSSIKKGQNHLFFLFLLSHDLVAFKGLGYFGVLRCCPLLSLVSGHTSDAQCGLASLCLRQSLQLAWSPRASEQNVLPFPAFLPHP